MPSEKGFEFTKESIDSYLKNVAKEYRKLVGKSMPAEFILIGGASVLINYGFRNMTTDIDAVIYAASAIKDAIRRVGDRFELPNGWLNDDFITTASFSPKLIEFSRYYKTYYGVLSVRTVAAEYLIAMKLRSGRQYKSDLSDVLGILAEHKKNGKDIKMEQIHKAVCDLYSDWSALPETSRNFIDSVMDNGDYEGMYNDIHLAEQETKSLMVYFEADYPGVTKEDNVDAIIDRLQKKSNRAEIIAKLRKH